MARRGAAHLTLMLVVTGLVFGVGAVQKAACANEGWVERREGPSFQCYSDIADLRSTEQLLEDRLPLIDRCAPDPDPQVACDEYPTVSMYVMRISALIAGNDGDPYARFYWVNVAVLLACALLVTSQLERLGSATLLFAGAPVLAIYGTMNWDLVAVALATTSIVLFLGRNYASAGAFAGVGAATKLYPFFALVAFVIHTLAKRDRGATARLIAAGGATWLLLNVPFAIAATDGWLEFFRFNSARPAEYDSLWRVACSLGVCFPTSIINVVTLASVALLTWLLWSAHHRRFPHVPTWHIVFPLVVLFVVTGKVWSPQYGLWLLPLFALLAPSYMPYLAWQATEVLVYLARFAYFDDLADGTADYSLFALAVVLRAAALAWCLGVWVRSAPVVDQSGPEPTPGSIDPPRRQGRVSA